MKKLHFEINDKNLISVKRNGIVFKDVDFSKTKLKNIPVEIINKTNESFENVVIQLRGFTKKKVSVK